MVISRIQTPPVRLRVLIRDSKQCCQDHEVREII